MVTVNNGTERAPGEIGSDRVLVELEAILASPEFQRAPVMRRLLSFLVRTTLAGRGEDLKAYSVAVDGLGRDPDFDAQTDSYPRVQVARLRKMLEIYYASAEPQDDIRFAVRPGGYRVHFESKAGGAKFSESRPEEEPGPAPNDYEAAPLPEKRRARSREVVVAAIIVMAMVLAALWHWGRAHNAMINPVPVLALEQTRAAGNAEASVLARRVDAVLDVALHRSWVAEVIQAGDQSNLHRQPDYRLAAQVNAGDGYAGRRLFLTLWDARKGNQIWSEMITLPEQEDTIIPVLRQPIGALMGSFGAIATDQRSRLTGNTRTTYECLLDADRYMRERDPQLRAGVIDCLSDALARDPGNANILAAASFLEYDYAVGRGTPAAHARGAELARRAVEANAYSAEAHLADARAAMIGGECVRGREIARRVVELNPYSAENIGLLGFLLYQCGDPEGLVLLKEARSLNSELPTFYFVAEMLALVESGHRDEALQLSQRIRRPGGGMAAQYDIVRTIASAARGDIPDARKYWERVARKSGTSPAAADETLRPYFFGKEFRGQLAAYLRRTGVLPAS